MQLTQPDTSHERVHIINGGSQGLGEAVARRMVFRTTSHCGGTIP